MRCERRALCIPLISTPASKDRSPGTPAALRNDKQKGKRQILRFWLRQNDDSWGLRQNDELIGVGQKDDLAGFTSHPSRETKARWMGHPTL